MKRNLWTVVGCAAKVNLRPPWSPSALALFIESVVRGFSLETFVRRNQKVASDEVAREGSPSLLQNDRDEEHELGKKNDHGVILVLTTWNSPRLLKVLTFPGS